MKLNSFFNLLLLTCLLSGAIGCSNRKSGDSLLAEVYNSNIQRLGNLYSVYQIQHKFKGPANESDFKSFIAQQSLNRLKKIGVDPAKLDELFVSERDKQPFKIRWGLVATPRQGPVPYVFEQAGVKGKYLVAFSSFILREVEQAEYDQLWSGKMDDLDPADARPKQ